MKANGSRRERGAYYTPDALAAALAGWAIRSRTDVVIDPAAGRGSLLTAAVTRLRALGARANGNVWAVELHRRSHQALRKQLAAEGVPARNVLRGDFFQLIHELPRSSVILANPPYVRHQEIPPRIYRRMRRNLAATGATIDGKASSWAYFLAIAPLLLKIGGRLATVVPTDLIASDYAAELLDYLRRCFASVRVCYCDGALFHNLRQRTALCLADDLQRSTNSKRGSLEFHVLKVGARALANQSLKASTPLMITPSHSLLRLLAPRSVLELERTLRQRPDVRPLGEVTTINIGYVTGDNRFFHLTEAAAALSGVGPKYRVATIRRARGVSGILFNKVDWKASSRRGETCWLFRPKHPLPDALRNLLRTARAREARLSSHCRRRTPWWAVPLRDPPAAFMIYMGSMTRIVSNVAGCQVSNTFYRLSKPRNGVSARDLAVASLTSVFQLSVLLNCRVLGGGLRKLEPCDAGTLLVPCSTVPGMAVRRIDRLVREGRWDDAVRAADATVLRDGLGWSGHLIDAVHKSLHEVEAHVLWKGYCD